MNLNVGVVVNVKAVRELLAVNSQAAVHLELPGGKRIPSHFHLTEVGKVRKDFIDCGGKVRSTERCVLQFWVADDLGHRLTAGKLAKIIDMGMSLLGSDRLAVEVEYDVGVITQFPVNGIEATAEGVVFSLEGKHTACLALEQCCPPAGNEKCCG